MKQILYNEGWKFWEVTNSFALNWAPPEDAKTICLPHDAMVETPQDPDAKAGANTGYRKGGVYSYSKTFSVRDPGKTNLLKIEGAYMNAFVYVNGQLACKRPFGYTSFYVPLNPYLNYVGENEIRIQVRSGAEPNSRWYPGTGLYRDVYLLEGGAQYIRPDDVMIQTTSIPDAPGGAAGICISATIASRTNDRPGSLEIAVTDAAGNPVSTGLVPVNGDPVTAVSASFATEPDLLYYPVTAPLSIPKPRLWDADHPNLYTCTLKLKSAAGQVLDTHSETFGIRTLSVSAAEGFRVNGVPVKLRGACIHHDSGILGAKTFEETHIRQIQILKESGFNAIRSAHNPAAPALLRACDKVGMYVMDEAFDMWTRHKSDYDYGLYFEEWWKADIESMVRNARNHPSVIMYSVGNEIPEIGTPQGGRITQMLCEAIKSLDPTRFTLASVNGIFSVGDQLGKIVEDVAADLKSQGKIEGNVNDFMAFMHQYMNDMTSHPIVDQVISVPFAHTDIAGYNYMGSRYELEHALHPDRVIVGSESGIGDFGKDWPMIRRLPNVIGDFCWTGWEYLGEAGIGMPNYSSGSNPFGVAQFPLQISGTGCIDMTGHRLPMSYYREIVFGLRTDPYIAVQDPAHYGEQLIRNPWIISDAIGSWSFSGYEGKPVVVEVYSNGEEVELLLNGVSLGRKPAGEAVNFITCFETSYESGTLTAVSYISGEETGRYDLISAAGQLQLIINAEPLYSTALPILEEPAEPEPAASEEGAAPQAQKEDIFADFTKYFTEKDPMANQSIDIASMSDKLKAEYQASSIKARELTEQLKASYLNGNANKPELILDISQSSLLQNASAAQGTAGTDPNGQEAVPAEAPVAAETEEPAETLYHIQFVNILLADEQGISAANQDTVLHLELEGEACMLAFGSSDPKPAYNYTESTARTWQGRAQLILKRPENGGSVRIKVTSETGLESDITI